VRPPQYAPPLQVDFLTLKVVSEPRVTWATSVPILVFLGLSVLDLGPMYATDWRQTASSHKGRPRHTWLGHHFQTFKIKRSKVNVTGAVAYCGGLPPTACSH